MGSGLTPGRVSARKAPEAIPKPGYAVGEETRTGTGPRQHAGQQQDRRRHDPDPATTPGSTAGSPGRAEDTPRPRQQAQQADPHRLNLVDLVDNATTTTPATIDSSTAATIQAPTAGAHNPAGSGQQAHGSEAGAQRPEAGRPRRSCRRPDPAGGGQRATIRDRRAAPRQQTRQRHARPTARHSARRARTADAPTNARRHPHTPPRTPTGPATRRPTTISPSPPTERHSPATRPTLDSWTAGRTAPARRPSTN